MAISLRQGLYVASFRKRVITSGYSRYVPAGLLLWLAASLTACSFGNRANSPEILYSKNASTAVSLQIPPDLTDVSDAEQFVLPGNLSGPVKRNTLLPIFDGVAFKRQGEASWLEIQLTPEEVWPRLLAFARQERLEIALTEPVNGLVVTAWQKNDEDGSIFTNLIGGSDGQYQRAAFRMERLNAQATRLFTRIQQAEKDVAEGVGANQVEWPSTSHSPEQTSEILQRLLVYLGIEEQRANGLLNDKSAEAIVEDASITNTAAGTQLVVHRGYLYSFDLLQVALTSLGFNVDSNDASLGEIRVTDSAAEFGQFTLKVDPVHISAVNVTAINPEGRPLDAAATRILMSRIKEYLA